MGGDLEGKRLGGPLAARHSMQVDREGLGALHAACFAASEGKRSARDFKVLAPTTILENVGVTGRCVAVMKK